MPTTACNLSHEVNVLHLQFFRSPAPRELVDRYITFHADSPEMMKATDNELRTMEAIVEKHLDALGIEPWLRVGSTRHLLSRKLLLIAYLAECDAQHPEFRRAANGRFLSLVQLCLSTTSGVWHLLRGRRQKALYGLL